MKKTTLFLADDHTILREGLRLILSSVDDFEVIGEASDGQKAIDGIEKKKPDVAIIDIAMPVKTGLDVARYIKKYYPSIKIIILSQFLNDAYISDALKNGVDGYVLKDYAGEDLIKAIHEVVAGEKYLSPRITSLLVEGYSMRVRDRESSGDIPKELLTNREKEVLKLIAEGIPTEEIGIILRISGHTVKVHRNNIMKKLKARGIADLVRYAIQLGLIN